MSASSCSTEVYSSNASMATDYFASPPEPLFNEPQNNITTELLQDTLDVLMKKNESILKESPDKAMCFKDTNSVLFLFELCRHLGLTPDVQYRAVELFHRFMIRHIEELYTHVKNSSETSSPIMWKDVEERLKHQITLRAVSCVQLASKLSSHYHLVTVSRARVFLSKCGFRYAATSIIQSEVRVLKTIKFRVHDPTPLEFIEVLLGALNKYSTEYPVKQLHGICLKILDLFYLSRGEILTKLKEITTTDDSVEEPTSGLGMNSMVLAASILTAASLVVYELLDLKAVIAFVCATAQVERDLIVRFAWVMLREVFTDERDMLEDI